MEIVRTGWLCLFLGGGLGSIVVHDWRVGVLVLAVGLLCLRVAALKRDLELAQDSVRHWRNSSNDWAHLCREAKRLAERADRVAVDVMKTAATMIDAVSADALKIAEHYRGARRAEVLNMPTRAVH